jgi:hypothetical protein
VRSELSLVWTLYEMIRKSEITIHKRSLLLDTTVYAIYISNATLYVQSLYVKIYAHPLMNGYLENSGRY